MKCIVILGLVALLAISADAIIRGENGDITKAPFIVSVRMFRSHVCGGVIVSQKHILTCGHCVTMTGGDVYSIWAGSTFIGSNLETRQEKRVGRVTLHKDYNPRLLRNDIAVLTLSSPLTLSASVQVANLVAANQAVPPTTAAYIWGWGLTVESKLGHAFGLATRLQAAKMSVVENDACIKIYGRRFVAPEVTCIGQIFTKQDACQGDHGGPVAIGDADDPLKKNVYCLMTWALGCNRGYPRVCINIAHYLDWIKSIITPTLSTASEVDTLNYNEHTFAMMNYTLPEAPPFEQPLIEEEPVSNSRIVGGTHGRIEEAPFAVFLRLFNQQICGGTIISAHHVLTSAHCVCYPGIAIYTIMPGSSLRTGGLMNMRVVNRISINQNYNPRTLQGDVAIVKTNQPIAVNHRTISIARLPPPGICENLIPNTLGLIAGWGMTQENNAASLPAVIQITRIPLLANDVCKKIYGGRFVPPAVICAGNSFGINDACQGDTGGPFVQNNMLIGGISWGFGCGRPKFPRVLNCISHYRKWIDTVIGS